MAPDSHSFAYGPSGPLAALVAAALRAESEEAMYQIIADWAAENLVASRVTVALLAEDGASFEVASLQGSVGLVPIGTRIPRHGSALGLVADCAAPRHWFPTPDGELVEAQRLIEQGVTEILNVPIFQDGVVIGAINLGRTAGHPITDDVQQRMIELADIVSSNLERFRLVSRTREQLVHERSNSRVLRQLTEVGIELSAATTPEQVFSAVAHQIQEIVPCDRVSLVTRDGDSSAIRFLAVVESEMVAGQVELDTLPGGGVFGRILEEGKPIYFANLAESTYAEHRALAAAGLISGISLPVPIGGQPGAVLNTAACEYYEVSDRQARALQMLTNLTGACLARITAQEEAARRARRLDALVDDLPLLVLTLNLDGSIVRVSEVGAAEIGHTASSLRGALLGDLYQGDDQRRVVRAIRRLSRAEVGHVEVFEAQLADLDGELRWVRHTARRVAAEPGEHEVVMVCEDITQERALAEAAAARDAALAASEHKSQFLATMSHEIRTPMNGVLGLSELLATTELDETQSKHLEGIRTAATGLLTVINDVLDMAKIESGSLALQPQPFQLADVVEDVARVVRVEIDRKELTWASKVAAEARTVVYGDAARVRQILLNLVGNAVKFTDFGSVSVHVRSEPWAGPPPPQPDGGGFTEARQLVFTVSDTGIGMTPEDAAHIFEPFEQAGNAGPTRTAAGTGLGLSISRRICEAMGGEITLASAPGVGSTFTVRLPMACRTEPGPDTASRQDAAVAGLPRQSRAEPLTTGTPDVQGRILLVEDNDINQQVALGMLNRLGYQVEVAQDGVEALDMAPEGGYDAILMDCRMPRLDGFATTRTLRLDPRTRAIPIIAMTANAFLEDQERCLDAGMDAYLSKPIARQTLADALGAWVGRASTAMPRGVGQGAGEPGGSTVARRVAELTDGAHADERREVVQLLDGFLTALPRRLDDVTESVESADCWQISLSARTLREAAATVGAAHLVAMCTQVEDFADAGDANGAAALLPALIAAAGQDVEQVRLSLGGLTAVEA